MKAYKCTLYFCKYGNMQNLEKVGKKAYAGWLVTEKGWSKFSYFLNEIGISWKVWARDSQS